MRFQPRLPLRLSETCCKCVCVLLFEGAEWCREQQPVRGGQKNNISLTHPLKVSQVSTGPRPCSTRLLMPHGALRAARRWIFEYVWVAKARWLSACQLALESWHQVETCSVTPGGSAMTRTHTHTHTHRATLRSARQQSSVRGITL